ncbi:MAG: hypothetical protein DLM67_24710 [Candidatus Nephthysia bennettiae]|nr:hypothetical protein [Candidatus Dormibacteraeota bacterium]PZR85965.1 MAG: hypothetical protein DLM67_24710 [Candidatus Dormibacteraeota bacterium]
MPMIGPGTPWNGAATVADALRVAAGRGFPAGLFSTDGLARLEAAAGQLPGPLTSTFGFEVALDQAAGGADLAVAVTALHGGREMLAGLSGPGSPLPRSDEPAWAAVGALCRAWALPGSTLEAELHNVALEFDLPDGQGGLPPPNVFVGARTGILPPRPAHPGQLELPVVGSEAWLLDTALPLLGRELSPGRRDALVRCFEALPAGSRAFQVGVMLARPVEALRVCVLGLDYEKVAPFLQRIGWPGDLEELHVRLGALAANAESVILDVDVADAVLPSLGLECFAAEDGDQDLVQRWSRFLDPLVRAGLCRPERSRALLEWPLMIRESEAPSWPRHLREASEFVGEAVEGTLVRALNHVKLGWRPGMLQAKGYLRVQHSWRPVRRPAAAEAAD